ncbi:single-stranded DNA-binding protein [Microbacterium sp. cx-55]|uniref:single-stranded DNA-binding protein n=1 Tax=Microbacterium sp. cx-55 TaxID=2875948 RepID=UPI001CC0C10F|nr:single-stranded DNA-binding protein [Microbacterium sp. cx-55]MBZ4486172.1 single-stranded DNA-binding protein [Microbacterium sp. cx-55]UGB33959.1 single-stranded DNA-binding protein [Microbacterium sp. cx-55]
MSEKITIVGNIAAVPERRDLPRGGAVTSFRIAVTHRRYDQTASAWVDDYTNWYTVSAFRALGEHAYESLHKGDRVVVTGWFRLREWEAGGRKGVSAEIDADALGHDLLWGTSTFDRKQSSRQEVAPTPTASEDDGAAADSWAAPGTERELVSTGETPF